MDYIDANKYYLKQICVVNKVDQKEMKKYAGIIWKCNDAVKPFHRGSIEVNAYRDQRMIALQYLQYDRHDLGMVERSASYLAMTNDLKSMVRDTVYKVQDVFGMAADRYMAIYEKFFGFMGDELHRDLLNDYSEAALYRIRSEALIAFGIVFDEIILPAVIRESDSEDSPEARVKLAAEI
ncbi:hypothetical protein ACTQZS_07180 [Bilifractor sp. LCP19S3_H10]|uniref:hypothetical protein n=1 Tax=Bilifractor sp. LCP19S3_H10 TaxID=3438736 RepID=UPI003F910BE5